MSCHDLVQLHNCCDPCITCNDSVRHRKKNVICPMRTARSKNLVCTTHVAFLTHSTCNNIKQPLGGNPLAPSYLKILSSHKNKQKTTTPQSRENTSRNFSASYRITSINQQAACLSLITALHLPHPFRMIILLRWHFRPLVLLHHPPSKLRHAAGKPHQPHQTSQSQRPHRCVLASR